MNYRLVTCAILLSFVGCSDQQPAAPVSTGPVVSLAEARKGFQTQLRPRPESKQPVDEPPAEAFSLVRYVAPAGELAAYLTPDPQDGKQHPAIVWITGGDCNSIGDVWSEAPPDNDQTAAAYRQAGIVMMFPSLRGGNDNPGTREGFLGEVDDILAAAEFLAKQPYVDPARVYLGGHSTGGTLVLLVSEYSDRFRAVFSFGPAHNPMGYGPQFVFFDPSNQQELKLRSPDAWLESIKSPTFVIEGEQRGNIESLRLMARATKNPNAHFLPVSGASHFDVLSPINKLLAQKILSDSGPVCNVSLTSEELNAAFKK